ncbi:MAG: asparaginase domain-containing protein [Planctomycetota bacterium]|nr:asparaginase domain-containing protein [Planctomycetota bacterium]
MHHIQIFSCGGTIDKVYFDAKSDYEVGETQIQEIFRRANVCFEHSIASLMRKDSLEMTDTDRELICGEVKKCSHSRILITHGTDTMPDTARALSHLTERTIVLTGSMTPSRFEASDAEFNIGCAVGALLSQPPGVYIAMNGIVFAGDKVRKNREAGRFEVIE